MNTVDDCTQSSLNYDEACVKLTSYADLADLWLYILSSDCHDCPYSRGVNLSTTPHYVKVDTSRSQSWRVVNTSGDENYVSASFDNNTYCQISPDFGQYGIYEFVIRQTGNCNVNVQKGPINAYLPLVIAIGVVLLLLSGIVALKSLKERRSRLVRRDKREGGNKNEEDDNGRTSVDEVVKNDDDGRKRRKRRVRSLDAVRGASILLMIFVNNGAGGYPRLEHATWNGLHFGDLVFPCFVWIMGVCVPLSITSRGNDKLTLCWAVFKRSFYLFLIGLSLNTIGDGNNQLENIRLFGVLQRFSVAYFVAATVYVLTYQPGNINKWKNSAAADVMMMLTQLAIGISIIATHTLIVLQLPVPNCPTGYLGPGGLHADGKHWNCTGGATGYLDKILLGERHVYQKPTTSLVYKTGSFDPEGLLGCLPSIFQVFLGMHAGQIIRAYKAWSSRLTRWLAWAVVYGFVAATLHYSAVIPINKNLWSFSFVMITTCFNLGLLSLFYLLIDVTKVWQGGPFRIPGMNALVMYAGHQICWSMFPFHWRIGQMNTHAMLLAESLWCVGLWTIVAYVLHWKQIYVRL